jgi:4-hydroxythreonine-4-phosphate dehydrogenase
MNSMSVVPTIAITMGDPSGIGPEILAKALAQDRVYQWCRPLVLGDAGLLSSCLAKVATAPKVRVISEPSAVQGLPGCVDLMEGPRLDREAYLPGRPTVEGGKAMVNYIQTAVGLALAGEAAAMVTCPINKALMH